MPHPSLETDTPTALAPATARNGLRTAYSSPEPEDLAALVRARYGAPARRARFLRRGLNDTYLLSGDGGRRWVFRLYRRWRSAEDVAFETAWLTHLALKGEPVVAPIAASDGRAFGHVGAPEGVRQFALFPHLGQLSTPPVEAVWAERFGRALADLHGASDDFEPPTRRFELDAGHLLQQPLRAIGELFESSPKEIATLKAAGARIGDTLRRLERTPWGYGPCHGDPHFENFVSVDGRAVWLDFDCGGLGWRMYDLAIVYWALKWKWPAWSVQYAATDEVIWDTFRKGYEAQRPIPPGEWSSFPAFVIARHIWALGLQATNANDWAAHNWLTGDFLAAQVQFLASLAAELEFDLGA